MSVHPGQSPLSLQFQFDFTLLINFLSSFHLASHHDHFVPISYTSTILLSTLSFVTTLKNVTFIIHTAFLSLYFIPFQSTGIFTAPLRLSWFGTQIDGNEPTSTETSEDEVGALFPHMC
jgi:hypothetical protein